jgi:hypothetical protein
MVFGITVGFEYYWEGLICYLWCLVLRWDLNIIRRVRDVTYGVWYCGGFEHYREGLRGALWRLVLRWDLDIMGRF